MGSQLYLSVSYQILHIPLKLIGQGNQYFLKLHLIEIKVHYYHSLFPLIKNGHMTDYLHHASFFTSPGHGNRISKRLHTKTYSLSNTAVSLDITRHFSYPFKDDHINSEVILIKKYLRISGIFYKCNLTTKLPCH